jgi:hypothetical protein
VFAPVTIITSDVADADADASSAASARGARPFALRREDDPRDVIIILCTEKLRPLPSRLVLGAAHAAGPLVNIAPDFICLKPRASLDARRSLTACVCATNECETTFSVVVLSRSRALEETCRRSRWTAWRR